MRKITAVKHLSLAGIMASAVCLSGAAHAQDADEGASGIGDIIVTARKAEESVQSVPVAITAFSQEGLEKQNVLNVSDLQNTVPGLFIAPNSQGGAPTFAIRAAKADNGTSATVTTYINDMPTATTYAVANMVYDMQSVSTLKGPQGTLFGSNSTGGAIIFRPNTPTDVLEGYIDVGYGSFDRKSLEAMLNIPVSEALALRIAGRVVRRDGYIKNLASDADRGLAPKKFNDDKHESIRFLAKITPNDTIQNDLFVSYFNRNDTGSQSIAGALRGRFDYPTFLGFSIPVDYALNGLFPSPSTRKVEIGHNPVWNKGRIWDVTNTTTFELSDTVTAKLALGYEHADLDTFDNNNATTGNTIVNGRTTEIYRQYTVEPSVDFTGADGALRLKLGAFYQDQVRKTGNSYGVIGMPWDLTGFPQSLVDLVPQFLPLLSASNYKREVKSKALYGQASYDLTDQLTATFGARYTWDEGKYTASNRTGLGQANVDNYIGMMANDLPFIDCSAGLALYKDFDPVACTAHQDFKTSSPSFTGVIEYKPSRDIMVYGTVRSGYLIGGFNNQVYTEGNFGQVFKPEKVLDGEIGIKADWDLAGRPIRTNFDVFYGKYKNQQRVQNGVTDQGTTFTAVQNAGKSHFYGADVEITYDIADMLQIGANYQYIHAVYDEFNAPIAIPGRPDAFYPYDGAKLSQTPEHTVNLTGTVTLPVPEEVGKISATLSYFWRSKTAGRDAPTIAAALPADRSEVFDSDITEDFRNFDTLRSYGLVNLSVNWDQIAGSNFDLRLWVKNLANNKYPVYLGNQMIAWGYAAYWYGEPRMIGANLKYSF